MGRRFAIVGVSGAGKSTLAQQISDTLGIPRLELDGVFHQPGWTALPDEDFRRAVQAWLQQAQDDWVIDGNYVSHLGGLVQDQADTVVWLDLPRHLVMRRIVRRTAGRVLLRRMLWNGNRETFRNLVSRDPQRNILLWAWTRHPITRARNEALVDERWVRLSTPREVESWLVALPSPPAPAAPPPPSPAARSSPPRTPPPRRG